MWSGHCFVQVITCNATTGGGTYYIGIREGQQYKKLEDIVTLLLGVIWILQVKWKYKADEAEIEKWGRRYRGWILVIDLVTIIATTYHLLWITTRALLSLCDHVILSLFCYCLRCHCRVRHWMHKNEREALIWEAGKHLNSRKHQQINHTLKKLGYRVLSLWWCVKASTPKQ